MPEELDDYIYKKEDIEKAYDMGWESAIMILEKSIGMSVDGQRELVSLLKKMRSKNRIEPFFRKY